MLKFWVYVCRVFVSCSRLASEKALTVRHALSGYICEALDHAPSLVILDDLDSIIPSSTDTEGSQPSGSVIALTEFLIDIMDEYGVTIFSCILSPSFNEMVPLMLMLILRLIC